MTKKKRFGLSQNLAQGLTEAITTAENHSGSMRYEVVALARIETDPENPRDLTITAEEISRGISLADGLAKEKQEELERLRGLAATIKKKGLINPVVVYKFGEKYRLVAGERRFLASILAGSADIQAKVLNEKPTGTDLRLLQWIENTEREDLSLRDRIGNVKAIMTEYKKENPNAVITASLLRDIISISLPQATAYMSVLNAPEDVKVEIENGKINNLDKAAYLAKIESAPVRQKALEAFISGNNLKRVKELVESDTAVLEVPMVKKEVKRGRVATRVNMGTTKKPSVIFKIVQAILKEPGYAHLSSKFNNVNWNEFDQASKAFRALINVLEKEVRT